MRTLRMLLTSTIILLSMYIFSASPLYSEALEWLNSEREKKRMDNVMLTVREETIPVSALENEAVPVSAVAYAEPSVQTAELSAAEAPEEPVPQNGTIIATNIEGGLKIKNQTGYPVDIGQLLRDGPQLRLHSGKMQILIIHTHSSEAYTPAGLDLYEASDRSRTEDTRYNIVRVGDELTEIFQAAGLNVIHDRNIYDYPSYTGSYTRSGLAIENCLLEYPDIGIVLDVHRDSLGENGVIYKTIAEEAGKCASQAMLLVGTDESGLDHSEWRQNLALAMYLQSAVCGAHPTLMRPVMLVPQRYNQHLTPGSLILEVGSDGNTLQEALEAARLFALSAAPALAALIE